MYSFSLDCFDFVSSSLFCINYPKRFVLPRLLPLFTLLPNLSLFLGVFGIPTTKTIPATDPFIHVYKLAYAPAFWGIIINPLTSLSFKSKFGHAASMPLSFLLCNRQ